jgi:hypothetical protein
MSKLKLNLDDLRVESFELSPELADGGAVVGYTTGVHTAFNHPGAISCSAPCTSVCLNSLDTVCQCPEGPTMYIYYTCGNTCNDCCNTNNCTVPSTCYCY